MSKRGEHVDDGYCRSCHTKKKAIGEYGEICPKCGPPADKPRYPPSQRMIARPDAPCKFCGRKDVSTCRSKVEFKDENGKREYTVWDARMCPMVKARKGSQDTVGSGGNTIWYEIPPSHKRFEFTGKVLPDKEVAKELQRRKKEDRNLSLEGVE